MTPAQFNELQRQADVIDKAKEYLEKQKQTNMDQKNFKLVILTEDIKTVMKVANEYGFKAIKFRIENDKDTDFLSWIYFENSIEYLPLILQFALFVGKEVELSRNLKYELC